MNCAKAPVSLAAFLPASAKETLDTPPALDGPGERATTMISDNFPAFLSRRQLLKTAACGFGYLALADLSAAAPPATAGNTLAPRPPHFKPRAKRVIFLFMQGAP